MILKVCSAAVVLLLFVALGILFSRTSRAVASRIWLVVFVMICGGGVTMMVAHAYLAKWGFREDLESYGLIHLMEGTAKRPFVYRRLAPDIIEVGTDLVLDHAPPRVIEMALDSRLRRYLTDGEVWNPKKAVAWNIAYLLLWLSLFGTLLAGAALITTVRRCSAFEGIITATIGMSLIPLMFVGGAYIYDAPELLLWTGLILCILRGWWLAVPIVFSLMLFNKESALLVIPALLPLFVRKWGLGGAVKWSAGLGVLGLAWVKYIHHRYAALPGQSIELWFGLNMNFWSSPASYFKVAALYTPGLPAPRGANVFLLTLLFFPLRFGWGRVLPEIRWSTVLAALVLVPLLLTSCFMDEVRNLSLLFPFLFIICVEGVHEMLAKAPAVSASP